MKSEGVRPLSAAGDSRRLQTLPGVMSVDPASAGPDSLSRAVMPGPDRWSSPPTLRNSKIEFLSVGGTELGL